MDTNRHCAPGAERASWLTAAVRAAEQEVPIPLYGAMGGLAQQELWEGDGAVWGRGAQGELSALCHS